MGGGCERERERVTSDKKEQEGRRGTMRDIERERGSERATARDR